MLISPLAGQLHYSARGMTWMVEDSAGLLLASFCGLTVEFPWFAADCGRSSPVAQVVSVTQRRMLKAIAAISTWAAALASPR